jgi:hypothetical protein
LLWLIEEDAVALVDGDGGGFANQVPVRSSVPDDADAAETALSVLKFSANWLHEPVFGPPAVQRYCLGLMMFVQILRLMLLLGVGILLLLHICTHSHLEFVR